jgi:hypothetical protein
VSGRRLYGGGTTVQQSPSLAGLAGGGRLRVRSTRGAVEAQAVPDPGVRRGTLWFPFNPAGGPGAGDLIDDAAPVTDVRLETL